MTIASRPAFQWRLRTRSLPLGQRTLLMAIVNLTPDSFSGDGLATLDHAIAAAVAAIDAGADILDLGAESTRPNAQPLGPGEEQQRLLPVLEAVLRERATAVLSVDTYHAATARAAVGAGVEIVNDVSGLLWDGAMAQTVADLRCGLVLMHTRGRPQEWASQPPLAPQAVVPLVLDGLRERLSAATAAGIPAGAIVLDPGFGFGKRGRENFDLLAGFESLHQLDRPLLAGLSRKGFLAARVSSVQASDPPAALRNATVAANVAAILAGAHIVRVHDLQAARESAAIADAVMQQRQNGAEG
jgi:dihydropteroate synthase